MIAALARHAREAGTRSAVAASGCYAIVAFLYFGLRLLVEPGQNYIGAPATVDPQFFIWFLAWWPHAILHGQNPIYTHVVWAPQGLNLTWTTSVPGLALLFSPVTLLFGPIVSYDVAAILLPVFAASTAFLLCRYLTRAFWPSFVGGYLFGFSSYILGQEEGHPNVYAVFLIPLVALALARYLDRVVDGRGLALRLAPLFALQVLLSTEIALTLGLALLISLGLGIVLVPERRERLLSALPVLCVAGLLAALSIGPFLYYLITGFQSGSINSPALHIADLANFVVPTKLALASVGWAGSLAARFPSNSAEQGAYLGLPTIAILGLYARREGRTHTGRFLLAAITTAALMSLGAILTIGGHQVVSLPWRLLQNRPILDNVLPTRLTMYVWLGVAVIVALWTARQRGPFTRWLLPALAILAILPNPTAAHLWTTPYNLPPFFTDSAYADCLQRNENVLVLPATHGTDLSLWQSATGFRFRAATGNIAKAPPTSFLTSPIATQIAENRVVPANEAARLRTFLRARGIEAVLVTERYLYEWHRTLSTIARLHRIGGIDVYSLDRLPPGCPAS